MKQKILNALKTVYANLGLSEKALDGVAAFLEKTITDESGIDAAVKEASVSALLKVYQSEMDSERGKASKALKDLDDYKKAHPDKVETHEEKPKNEWEEKLAALEAKMAKTEQALAEANKKANRETLVASVKAALLKAGADDDYVLKNVLKGMEITDADTAETLSEKYKKVYDEEYVEAFGEGAVPRKGSKAQEGYKKGDNDAFLKELQAEGLVPSETK